MESSVIAILEGSLEPSAPQANHATTSRSVDTLAQTLRQTTALANCGPLIIPGALDEAYTMLTWIQADL